MKSGACDAAGNRDQHMEQKFGEVLFLRKCSDAHESSANESSDSPQAVAPSSISIQAKLSEQWLIEVKCMCHRITWSKERVQQREF